MVNEETFGLRALDLKGFPIAIAIGADVHRHCAIEKPALKRFARSVLNSGRDDNPRRVRSVENHIGIGSHHGAADIALVGKAS